MFAFVRCNANLVLRGGIIYGKSISAEKAQLSSTVIIDLVYYNHMNMFTYYATPSC